ncbi:MAG: RidA family protein [Lachnospiraceae bacterium]
MEKYVVNTKAAPAAIGPYSQAIEVNGFIYTSGMIPVIPETGEVVEGIEAQARQALSNVRALLESQGSGMEQIIKTTVFIKNMDDFAKVNEIYATFFEKDFPARSCVEVARLPKDVLIEMEAIALKTK